METVIWWFILGGAVGVIASFRGRNGVGWGLGSIVCPIVGLLILLCIPNLRTEARFKAQHEELLRNLQPKG